MNIEDDINIEANETFKIMLEAVDVNVYVLVDTVTVVIIDDDNITRKYLYIIIGDTIILLHEWWHFVRLTIIIHVLLVRYDITILAKLQKLNSELSVKVMFG